MTKEDDIEVGKWYYLTHSQYGQKRVLIGKCESVSLQGVIMTCRMISEIFKDKHLFSFSNVLGEAPDPRWSTKILKLFKSLEGTKEDSVSQDNTKEDGCA